MKHSYRTKTFLYVTENGKVFYVGNENSAERNELREKVLIGSEITSHGITVKVSKVFYAELTLDCHCVVEFIDEKGNYRHWKQAEDKGYIECKNLYFSAYGMDITNSFERFGYQTTF